MSDHFCSYCDHPAECHRCASCGESMCEYCTEDGRWHLDAAGERRCSKDCGTNPPASSPRPANPKAGQESDAAGALSTNPKGL